MTTYRVTRFFQKTDPHGQHLFETIKTGLTLEEAQRHCQDPETSSTTATSAVAVERTRLYGPWFDGYDVEVERE